MKIAVNARFLLSDQLEGFGWYTHEILKRMVAAHPADEFFFLFDRSFDPKFIYGPNVRGMSLFPPARHPILFRWWFEWSVRRALKRIGADVFFSPDSMCSLRADTPTLMTVHDLAPLHKPEDVEKRHRNYLLKNLPRWINRADRILTVSEYVKRDILQTIRIPSSKVEVVYNGCREGFDPLNRIEKTQVRQEYAEGQDYFLYTGAIHPRKNIVRMIKAFDIFKEKTGSAAKLLLAGREMWGGEEIKAAHQQAKHKADIRLLGYVEEKALHRLTAAALAMVYISLEEGFGLPMVEAMYAEVPVIAANASCLPEIAGDAALMVDPLSEDHIALGMQTILENRVLAMELIEKGKIRRNQFNWDLAASRIYDLLKSVADG